MLERFTVDVLAEHVATQLLEGEPTPKLAHRFFRKGRRDGRRAYDHASVSKLLTDAVHLAGSTLVEELTAARRDAKRRIAECEAAIEAHGSMGAAPAAPAPEAESSSGSTQPTSGATLDSAQLLLDALQTRNALRARREADARSADARSKHAARVAALEAAESAAIQAKGDIAKIERELTELPEHFRQRFESIKHTGEMLWSRYCNGFVQGEGRRGSRASDVQAPSGGLDFVTPAALGDQADPAHTEDS